MDKMIVDRSTEAVAVDSQYYHRLLEQQFGRNQTLDDRTGYATAEELECDAKKPESQLTFTIRGVAIAALFMGQATGPHEPSRPVPVSMSSITQKQSAPEAMQYKRATFGQSDNLVWNEERHVIRQLLKDSAEL